MARIFEQTPETTPDTSFRFASGLAGNPTKNITIANFVAWLQGTALSFMKGANNLSDVDDAETARSNLDTYSTTEVDELVDTGGTSTDWLDGTINTSFLEPESYLKVKRTGAFITVFGIVRIIVGSDPEGQILFNFPAGITLKPSEDIYFVATEGGGGTENEMTWLYASSLNAAINCTAEDDGGDKWSTGTYQRFFATYPIV